MSYTNPPTFINNAPPALNAANLNVIADNQRDHQTRLARVEKVRINVLNHGTVADYNRSTGLGTDNTAAFQDAINTAYAAGGGVVFVPKGLYGFNGAIRSKEGVVIEGAGYAAVGGSGQNGTYVIRCDSSTSPLLEVYGSSSFTIDVKRVGHGIQLRNMNIEGGAATANVIDMVATGGCVFDRVFFSGGARKLIHMLEVFDSRFYNCRFDLAGSADGSFPQVHATGNIPIPGDPHSRVYDTTNEVHFVGCVMEAFKGVAFRAESNTNQMRFVDCKFESGASNKTFFVLDHTKDCTFTDTVFTSRGDAGQTIPSIISTNVSSGLVGNCSFVHLPGGANLTCFGNLVEAYKTNLFVNVEMPSADYIGGAAAFLDDSVHWADISIRGFLAPLESTKPLFARTRRILHGSAPPDQAWHGQFKRGDIIFNTLPSPGGTVGWMCTTAGNPGTWKSFGTLAL
jgi:hypothetical protein